MEYSSWYRLTLTHTCVYQSIPSVHSLTYCAGFQRIPHVYTTPSSPDAARCWIPCVDSVYAKCAWEFEFIVPSYLEEREELPGLPDDEFDYPDDRNRTVVVCSGDLVEQVRVVTMQISFILSGDRLHTPITPAKPSFCSVSSFLHQLSISHSQRAHSTSSPSHPMLQRRFLVHGHRLSCMPFVCQVRRPNLPQLLRSCAVP